MVQFEVSVTTHGLHDLFTVEPAISSSGALTFTPGPDQYGLAELTVRAKDDGGLEDCGIQDTARRSRTTRATRVAFWRSAGPIRWSMNLRNPPRRRRRTLTEKSSEDCRADRAVPGSSMGDVDADGDALEILSTSDPRCTARSTSRAAGRC